MNQIDPATTVGAVRLTVSELDRSREFYTRAIGLAATVLADGTIALGTLRGPTLVELHGDSSAPAIDRRATGLFHLAILLPDRRDLAHALGRIAQARWPLDGASDHLVSEALYLADPDGNGIELYRDRPRVQWPRRDGRLEMATLPLDLDGLAGELAAVRETGTRSGRDNDRARAPPGLGAAGDRGVLCGRARLRRDRAPLPRRAVRLRRQLPPPHRTQHLAERRRLSATSRLSGATILRGGAAEQSRARAGARARAARRHTHRKHRRRLDAGARPVG